MTTANKDRQLDNSQRIAGIKDVPVGQTYTGFCVLRRKERRLKSDGQPFLVLELGDASGRLKAWLWDDVERWDNELQPGHIVKIQAVPELKEGKKCLRLVKIRRKKPEEKVDLEQLLPRSHSNVTALKEKFFHYFSTVQDKWLVALLEKIRMDEDTLEAYLRLPGGKLWHHPYLYGMLEHLVAMLELAEVLGNLYPKIHRDLLKTGIIVHDIGKLWELDWQSGFIEISTRGRLIGHSAMGWYFVMQKIQQIPNFPEELTWRLGHMILSHLGENERGATLPPMTLEAFALYLLDKTDTTLNAISRIMEKDVLPNQEWSKFIPLLQRFIYVGKQFQQSENREAED